ncbi:MAG: UDP-N-acetylmuramoyl-L-alanyl-D-glutamate--2,6-diaminopimelate ligase [Desulfobaccales bacterium]
MGEKSGQPQGKTLRDLLTALTDAQVQGDDRFIIPGLAYHSQKVVPGGVFVALRGARTDGHRFLNEALGRGARVVVTEEPLKPPSGVTVVRVPQARLALAHLSAAFYDHPSQEMVLVGITGTNGKTTTSFLLESILRAAGHRVGVVGTVNYRAGDQTWPAPMTTPESLDLQRLLRDMRNLGISHVVLEVSSHALIQNRVDCCQFAAGVFTNLSQDHLDYHRDLDEYFRAKSRLFFEVLKNGAGRHGLSILNLDDPWGLRLHDAVATPKASYGHHLEGTVHPISYRYERHGLEAVLATPLGELAVTSTLVGPYNLSNIMAAVATALGLGLEPATVAAGVAYLAGVPGRLERVGPPEGPAVFVDYAHTPDALNQVLAALNSLNFARIITVFGCGGDRDRSKRPLMGQAAARGSALVVITSDNPRTEDPAAIIRDIEAGLTAMNYPSLTAGAAYNGERGYLTVPDRREAIRLAIELAGPADAVLVAGKGHEDYQIWGQEKLHFNDREEALEALKEYHC